MFMRLFKNLRNKRKKDVYKRQVVFNHTAEGNEMGPCFSFKGIDNNVYYMLTPVSYTHLDVYKRQQPQ